MSNTPPPLHNPENTVAIFEQLRQQDIEEFYLVYQYWHLQHQIEILQNRLIQTRSLLSETSDRIQQLQPTAIELATLARLQSNGVSDVDLLDQMLERGESWLDRTMQRLDYLEQLDDFIRDDYTQWCRHALEGAYDWIDTVIDSNATSLSTTPATIDTSDTFDTSTNPINNMKEEDLIEATEELFLQKISSEDELLMHEITMKRPSITAADLQEVALTSEETAVEVEVSTPTENTTDLAEEERPVVTAGVKADTYAEDEALSTSGDIPPITNQAHPIETSKDTEFANIEEVNQDNMPSRQPGLMKRFLGKIWGS